MLVWSLVIAQKNKALLQLLPNTGAKESSSSPKKAKPEKLWLWLPQNGKTKKALALAPAKRQHQKSSGSGLGKIDLEKKTRLRLQKKIKAWTTVGQCGQFLPHIWYIFAECDQGLVNHYG